MKQQRYRPWLLVGGGIVELRWSTTQATIPAPNSGGSSSVGSEIERKH
jgi:hypothetical protein